MDPQPSQRPPHGRPVTGLTPGQSTPAPGRPAAGHGSQRLLGPYEVLGELGRGGVGVVYRARDTRGGREVAVKVLLQGLDPEPQKLERFRREAVITAALAHPGIVHALDAGSSGGRAWIAFELVEGARTLTEVMPTLPVRRRVELIRDAARALGAAHRRDVVHRDVKPANILVDAAGRARVTDFGLAAARGMSPLTQTGSIVGTPLWMSPEQADSRKDLVGPATDVWGLGVVLYEALTGAMPFEGATLMDLVDAIRRGAPRPPRHLAPVDPALEAACLRALQKDPARRQRDGDALADELDRALTGADDLARSDTQAGDAAPPAPRRRALLGVHVALGAASLALLAALFALRGGPSPEELLARGRALEPRDPGTARVVYEQAARAGSLEAMSALARLLDAGRGGPADRGEAEAWWRRAADHGDAGACVDLARRDERRGDPAAALGWWRRAATAGDVDAMLALAERLERGRGAPPDPAAAATWWRRAAERGHTGAMRSLATVMAADPALAAEWLRRAAERGDLEAMVRLARLLEQRPGQDHTDSPAMWLERAATGGHPGAMVLVAERLEAAGDDAAARGWLERAASQGHVRAMAALAARLVRDDAAGAARWLERGAMRHDPACMHALGVARLEGRGVARDPAAALPWLLLAAASGEAGAATRVGELFERGEVVPPDLRGARAWFERGAHLGDAVAMTRLGALLVEGRGGPKDLERAARLFERAAAAGAPPAMFHLGRALERGEGVARDVARATSWYRQGASAGDARSMLRLAELLEAEADGRPERIAEAADLYRRAAELGDTAGMNNWGHALATGEGVARDEAAAARWFHRAAEAGAPAAMVNFARQLLEGRGVARDPAEARRWLERAAGLGYDAAKKRLAELDGATRATDELAALRRAAEGGDAAAATALGRALREGAGVERDLAEAARWLRRAADAGRADARALLAEMHLAGAGVPRDPSEALRLLSGAAEAGDLSAMTGLGRLLLASGTPKAWPDGVRWLDRAAAAGHGPACMHLAWAAAKGRGVRRNVRTAMRLLQRAAEKGEREAALRLARLMDDLGHSTQARTLWKAIADKGDPHAMVQLARVHAHGRGGAVDAEAARRWLTRAVEAGHPDALVLVARAAPPDVAAELWRRAAEGGSTDAMVELARRLRDTDPDAARGWLERAVARGDAEAALLLAAASAE